MFLEVLVRSKVRLSTRTSALSATRRMIVSRRCYATHRSTAHEQPTESTAGSENPKVGLSSSESRGARLIARTARAAARGTSYLFYTMIVAGGLGLTGLVVYYFTTTVLAPGGDIPLQSRAAEKVLADSRVRAAVGENIVVHGSDGGSRWTRNRPASITRGIDRDGVEHVWLQFIVEGSLAEAVVTAELLQQADGGYNFRYLVADTGKQRVILIEPPKPTKRSFLGIRF
ncbi:TIM21-domain-containing protein [Dipodascopsis uninucleata]